MGFIASYKHLEKLCREILNDSRAISAYIDEMRNIHNGSYYVRTWEEDLKKLKHYRRIRNQIAHDPGCTEENMCEPKDELWIEEFYSRILNQTDPLALYRKATTQCHTTQTPPRTSARRNTGCVFFATVSVLLFAAIILLMHSLLT